MSNKDASHLKIYLTYCKYMYLFLNERHSVSPRDGVSTA
jgi:hypothetical protein